MEQSSDPIPYLHFTALGLVAQSNNLSGGFMRPSQRVLGKGEIIHYQKIGMTHTSSVDLEEGFMSFGGGHIDLF
jgi:hypothetical protein